jgi:CBS domain-containing protein
MSAKVQNVMTSRAVAVRMDAPFKDIATLLTRYRISALPVLDDDGKVIGVVSETDLLCKEVLIAAMGGPTARPGPYHDDFARAAAVTAAELMTTPPVTISPGEPVTGAARLILQSRFSGAWSRCCSLRRVVRRTWLHFVTSFLAAAGLP